jgi:Tol biopolymer transport system component
MRRAAVLCFLASIPAYPQEKRLITQTDLYAFQWIGSPQISPDGSQVAYTRVTVTAKHDNYDTSLWIIPSGGGSARQLTAGPHDSAPRWSPDGKTLAFVRVLDGKPPTPQIFLLPMQGGEARALTDMPKGAGAAVWSADGKNIAFTSSTKSADFDKKEEEKSDVRVITKAAYRDNSE